MTILDLINHTASRQPDAPALLASSRKPLSYASLRQQTTYTIAALRAAGVATEDKVAVVLPNGTEMAAAVVAVASGAICAPLNPAYGEDELRFYLSDLGAKVLLLPAGYEGAARVVADELGIRCLPVSWDDRGPAGRFELLGYPGSSHQGAAMDAVDNPPAADDVALVLHTSGTTSRPKIVPLTQANLCSSARNIAAMLQLSQKDSCLSIMPLFHIHGIVGALLASLVAGGSIACTPGYRDGRFLPWLAELQSTWTTAVPSMYQAILAELASSPGATGHQLRFVRSSSAPLPPTVMRELESRLQVPVIEAYGMTEAAHQMTSNPLPPGTRKPRSVGLAAGPEVAIMDAQGQLQPAGITGEIVIRGDSVTAGYENNPKANGSAFSGGWFRTGDQGYMDAEDYLFLTGRLKEIINRGGEKVSPREVDEALLEYPAVGQAVAFAVQHETLGEDIAAAVVLKPGANETAEQIRAVLFGRLAESKIPSQLIIVDSIPKGPTGKIQRIGLEAKLQQHLRPPFIAPRDGTEAQIADIFAEVLGTDAVGASTNFFSLGGDSLRGFQVLARLKERLNADLSILDLFKSPTPAQLVEKLEVPPQQGTGDAMEQLLAEIEALTDDEARLQLRQLQDGSNG